MANLVASVTRYYRWTTFAADAREHTMDHQTSAVAAMRGGAVAGLGGRNGGNGFGVGFGAGGNGAPLANRTGITAVHIRRGDRANGEFTDERSARPPPRDAEPLP